MYLVGLVADLREEQTYKLAKFKQEITKEDLVKCKNDSFYQVIDILNKKYYCPDNNDWIDIPSE